MRFRSLAWVALLLAACLCTCDAGCASRAQQAQARQTSQLDTLIKSSGGNWNNLTPAQQQYMIKTVGKGSLMAAQMDFWAQNHQLDPDKGIKH